MRHWARSSTRWPTCSVGGSKRPGSSPMRHARPDDLERIAPLLEHLRALDQLTERTPGSFYRKSSAFLHFHVDGENVYADVKLSGREFDRMRVTTKAEQRSLLAAVRGAVV